ncbi:hypothetical protein V6N13_019830 [Hibiscus sabdariffa]
MVVYAKASRVEGAFGCGNEALDLFQQILDESYLVECNGRRVHGSIYCHGFSPIFLSGYLEEFKKFVKSLPFEPNVAVLTRAFDACMKHDAVRYGEWAAEQHN